MARLDKQLLAGALIKYLAGLIMIGLLLFLPAGTMRYWNAWVLISALFGPMLVLGAVLLLKSPDLLAKRLDTKEKESKQKIVVALSELIFLAAFILAGLDFRYGWTEIPDWAVLAATAVLLLSYAIYSATIFLFLSMPLVLGSMLSFVVMLAYVPVIALRVSNEEKVLSQNLKGYEEYRQKVRSKVIPFIW